MLKAMTGWLALYLLLVIFMTGFLFLGLHDVPTISSIDCERDAGKTEPSCRMTERFFMGLYTVITPFTGIREARSSGNWQYGKHGSYILYGLRVDDGQGKTIVSTVDFRDQQNSLAEAAQLNAFRDNPSMKTIHVTDYKTPLIWLGTIFGFSAALSVFLTIIGAIQSAWDRCTGKLSEEEKTKL